MSKLSRLIGMLACATVFVDCVNIATEYYPQSSFNNPKWWYLVGAGWLFNLYVVATK